MKSLRWQMLVAMGMVIAVTWCISIAMFFSYLSAGQSNPWHESLDAMGDRLVRILPSDWVGSNGSSQASAPPVASQSASPAVARVVPPAPIRSDARTQSSETAGLLTAMVLNTFELAIVGLLLWLAVVGSLKPLTALSASLSQRSAYDPAPLESHTLPAELRPLIRAFNSLLQRVDVAMRAQRQFIADAAHELRTPLAALHVHAEVARRAASVEAKDDAIVKLLEVSRRAQRLSEQLLDLARLEAGLHTSSFLAADLFVLSKHVISEFSVQAQSAGAKLSLLGESCKTRCDVDEIGILIRNVIDNAIQHGGAPGEIEIECAYLIRNDKRCASIEVRDNGPGVPASESSAIFERFYRASSSTGRGSGIGLSLVAGIADLHGATIETGSGKGGRGFSIRIVFPG
jgi:two-component system sensor histidine kinase QseC